MKYCENCRQENEDNVAYCSSCGQPLASDGAEKENSDYVNRCDYCAKRVTYSEYFTCRYCGKKLCYDHRLPENHLCKSTNMRRFVPGEASSASASYSYSYPYYQRQSRSTFGLSLSRQGRNLAILIVAGLGIGFISEIISVGGVPVIYYLIQDNFLVYQGWVVPLVTSIIVAPVTLLGLYDVFFNAIAIIFMDRLLSLTYTRRQYYSVFLATGVFGNILSLVSGPNFASFGASGGIFGLIAGAVTFDYAVGKRVNSSLVIWFVIIFVFSSFGGNTNWLAHLGGAALGLVAGFYIGKKRK